MREEILKLFSGEIRKLLEKSDLKQEYLQEIRLRINAPLIVVYDGREFFLTPSGKRCRDPVGSYYVSHDCIRETLEYLSGYSLYAYEEEIRQGYITVQGGHRVGLAGKTVLDGEKIKSIQHISFINVRFSHQIMGCAQKVLPFVAEKDRIYHTLIISPPRCGKTTLLRDLIRQISDGSGERAGHCVGVVDERSEIGGCYHGIPQNDVGIRTDVLDGCPKAEGMMMLIRSMSPEVIAVDEIGSYEDIHAIETVINCGCKLLATVHGSSIDDIRRKPLLDRLVKERVFERYILLDARQGIGTVRQIFDERGTCLFQGTPV
ncbi:MAG: stage III sporulation protein AA [Ruminococcus sp.]|jgi:stage III sporulation protein AA